MAWQDHAANDTTGPGTGPIPGPVGWGQGKFNKTMSKMKPFVVGPKKHHDQVWVWKNLFSIRGLGSSLGTRLEPRAIVACKNASKIIGGSNPPRKSDKRKELRQKR